MAGKRILLLAALLAACVDEGEPLVVALTATVDTPVTLDVPAATTSDAERERWELSRAPDDSGAMLHGDADGATFVADRRGIYVVDRYLGAHLAEQLTHHFVVTLLGAPPVPSIRSATTVPVGSAVVLDGSASASAEGLPLIYSWRLVSRPRGSLATLEDVSAPSATLVPDVPGAYPIELMVNDGELWSGTPAWVQIVAR